MRQFYLFLCTFTAFSGFAQIQITQAHMPSIGDTIRYTNSGSGSFDFTVKGANQHWDFKTLGFLNQDIYKFQALLSTPYSTLAFSGMPVGAIGYKVADSLGQGQASFKNIYNFYQKSANGWYAVGTGFTLSSFALPAGGVYKDKDEIYTFPLKYNDKDSTTFEVITPLGSPIKLGTFTQKGYRLNYVEGWGTISTPYGSNISCLKIKSVIYETDSLKVSIPPVNIGFQTQRVEYKWLSTSEKIPVLEVTGTEIAGVFTPTIVRYRDHYRTSASNPVLPRVKFSSDKTSGKASKDTFRLNNSSTPRMGTSWKWTVTPSKGVRFVKSTSDTSFQPVLVCDSTGTFSVTLKATNLAGSKDSTAASMLVITKDNNNSVNSHYAGVFEVYPNPATTVLVVNAPGITGTATVFDACGRTMLVQHVNNSMQLDISAWPPGLYTLQIDTLNIQLHNTFIKE